MKIDQQARGSSVPSTVQTGVGQRAGSAQGFATLLDSAVSRREEEELDQLFDEVTATGEQLVTEGSLEAALRYKQSVKKMMDRVVKQALQTTGAVAVDRTGRRKQFLTVDEIDKHLLALTEAMIGKQKEPLDLLHLIGEIKGLLISLRL